MFNYKKIPKLIIFIFLWIHFSICFRTHQLVLVQVQRWYGTAVYAISLKKRPGAYLILFIY